MPKCPECGNEYEGICPTCNHEEPVNDVIDEKSPDGDSNEDVVLLTTVTDNFEASLIETRLKQSGIPVLLKYRESGAYLSFYMGKTSFGVDIYVPSRFFEEARMMIECPPDEADEESENMEIPEEESLDEAKKQYQKRIEFRSWIVFIFIILFVLAVVLISYVS